MSQLIHYTNCPACGAEGLKPILTAKDYTVSSELFVIVECTACTLRFTQDVPNIDSIGPYYKSENYISHTNTSKGFINSLYQSVRKRTLKQKRKLIEKTTGLKTGNFLDVGSGTGAFASEMKQAGWQITGLEPDDDARKVAVQINNVDLNNINLFYDLPENSFDAITMWHVLEHVHDLQGYITKLKSILKENGKLFIAVPNYTSKDAAIYQEHWAAYDVPRHLYHFSPQSMKILIEKHGMRIEQYKPMWYDSFYVSMLSSKYKNARLSDRQGKSNLFASFFNGLRSNSKALGNVQRCSSVIYIIGK
ncbi:MAG: class I SAM-dependent methyltransferase [Chitinophagaceae bacterium]|nr:class I SAM-dependent methyltransferase [Chitinophagaceae bacterium]